MSRAAKDHRYSVSEKGRDRRRAADARYKGTAKGIAARLRYNEFRRLRAIQEGR